MRKSLIALMMAFLLLLPGYASAAEPEKIEVGFNQIQVKVNGVTSVSNNLLYEGTTYVPVRNLAEMLGWDVIYYDKTRTAYIGMLPAGEVPDEVIDAAEAQAAAASEEEVVLEDKRFDTIEAVFNDIAIQVHGIPVETSNILYNGTTYAPIRAVAEIMEMDVHFYGPTSTAYIGTVPQGEVPFETYKEWYPDAKRPLSHEPATGEMEGWQLLKGHEYEDLVEIYYRINGTILYTQMHEIREVDLNQVVEWVDDSGNKRYNTVGDLYDLFGSFSRYSSDWFYEKFGDLYMDWFFIGTIRAEDIVEDYVTETGQQ
ncbi:Copper amine oxidase N-terminal domain [Chlamydia abortus]|uniref:Stalk domain-containing protein n=1 Tax=Paenibacillus residui TaxID=629724 RepID=A0ABW3D794_9BACL|nr:stalk domain-containing protein [Paenibacillus sp. 32O-W]SHE12953.1 Copper amine oxidase N-terminal domain [Chlamydia abortus]